METRIEALETKVRILQVGILLGLVAVGLGMVVPRAAVVQAELFEVVNQEGTVLAQFGLSSPGQVYLPDLVMSSYGLPYAAPIRSDLQETNNLSRMSPSNFSIASDSATMLLNVNELILSPGQRGTITLAVSEVGPWLSLYDGRNGHRTILGESPLTNGTNALIFVDQDGAILWRAPR